MLKKYHHLLLGAGIFLLFVLFSYLVHKNYFNQFDFDITVHLQDNISRRWDPYFSLLSISGGFTTMSIALGLLLLWRHKWWGILVVGAYGFIHLFELYGKFFVQHRPPPHFMLRTEYPINFPQFYVSAENSYPSGHAARTMFVSLLIYFLVKDSHRLSRHAKWVIYVVLSLYDLIMLVSRPYLGEHWTSDVIGGSLLGLSLVWLVKRCI